MTIDINKIEDNYGEYFINEYGNRSGVEISVTLMTHLSHDENNKVREFLDEVTLNKLDSVSLGCEDLALALEMELSLYDFIAVMLYNKMIPANKVARTQRDFDYLFSDEHRKELLAIFDNSHKTSYFSGISEKIIELFAFSRRRQGEADIVELSNNERIRLEFIELIKEMAGEHPDNMAKGIEILINSDQNTRNDRRMEYNGWNSRLKNA